MHILFLPNPNNLPVVNHKDGHKNNCAASNLEWCTSSYNNYHKYNAGLFDKNKISGENNHNSKLTKVDIETIRKLYVKGSRKYGAHALGRMYDVSYPTINSIIKKETWKF